MVIPEGMTLEQAIVAQACEDYRLAIRKRCNNPDYMLQDTLRFFKSEWYKALTDIDYKWLLCKLDQEFEEGKMLIEAGDKIERAELKKKYYFTCPICGGTAHTIERKFKNVFFRSYFCEDCKTSENNVPYWEERENNA